MYSIWFRKQYHWLSTGFSSLLVIALSLCTGQLIGQVGSLNDIKPKTFFGVYSSLDYNYRNLWSNDDSADSKWGVDLRDEIEIPIVGYSAGLTVGMGKDRHEFSFQLGYALRGYQTKCREVENMPVPEIKRIQTESRFSFIDLGFTHTFLIDIAQRKFGLNSGFGMSYLIEERQWTRVEYVNNEREVSRLTTPYDYTKFNLLGHFGISYHWPISERWLISCGPHFQIVLNKMIDTPITFRLYQGGLKMCLRRK